MGLKFNFLNQKSVWIGFLGAGKMDYWEVKKSVTDWILIFDSQEVD
jgi:hypothetical protein